jgi:hypothetical protein
MKLTWLSKITGTALIYCIIVVPATAAPPDFSVCDGLTGAARGLCRGGVAAGCADGTGNPAACMAIEDNFMSVTGVAAPWLTTCPCNYLVDVPINTAWIGVTDAVFSCPANIARVAAVLPLPQLPQVTAIITTEPQPVCQAVTSSGGNVREINEEELSACREDVIQYGLSLLFEAVPGLAITDVCSPLIP